MEEAIVRFAPRAVGIEFGSHLSDLGGDALFVFFSVLFKASQLGFGLSDKPAVAPQEEHLVCGRDQEDRHRPGDEYRLGNPRCEQRGRFGIHRPAPSVRTGNRSCLRSVMCPHKQIADLKAIEFIERG
ncbi:MAG: hypothetical protein OXB99_15380 [Acidimicrobiaceae bacterium]|nr:hypothetical protein [Acidimicrobiaceae bacterium]